MAWSTAVHCSQKATLLQLGVNASFTAFRINKGEPQRFPQRFWLKDFQSLSSDQMESSDAICSPVTVQYNAMTLSCGWGETPKDHWLIFLYEIVHLLFFLFYFFLNPSAQRGKRHSRLHAASGLTLEDVYIPIQASFYNGGTRIKCLLKQTITIPYQKKSCFL